MPTNNQKLFIMTQNGQQPPIPAVPPEDADNDHPASPRCHFCGQLLEEVAKIEYPLGNGFHKYVFVCEPCKKNRDEEAARLEQEDAEGRKAFIVCCVVLAALAIVGLLIGRMLIY